MEQRYDLENLLSPVSPDDFKTMHWEKEPLLIERDERNYFEGLFSLKDFDSMLSNSSLRSRELRVLREGKPCQLSELATSGLTAQDGLLDAVYAQYREGHTIVLQFIHERWNPLKRLCQSLAAEFSAGFQVNAYLTPPNEQGLLPHYDTHDVFVIQTHGSKHWTLYEDRFPLPLRGTYRQPQGSFIESMKVWREFDLKPGDLLYIPRGQFHEATSREKTSLHLTVGAHTVTWAAVLITEVGKVVQKERIFRESLPVGFARDKQQQALAKEQFRELLKDLCERIDIESAIDNAIEVAARARAPHLDGHLLDLEMEPLIDAATPVCKRAGLMGRVVKEAEEVCLCFRGKAIHLPPFVEPDLRFIAETAFDFTPADLPGVLDSSGRLVLIRSLIREGFLTVRDG